MECPEYYKTLNCNIHSTQDEIRKAYRKLSLQHHPDRNGGDSGIFKCVNEAYETLGDPDKRKKYDIMSQKWTHTKKKSPCASRQRETRKGVRDPGPPPGHHGDPVFFFPPPMVRVL